jgi:hypothetical protein
MCYYTCDTDKLVKQFFTAWIELKTYCLVTHYHDVNIVGFNGKEKMDEL